MTGAIVDQATLIRFAEFKENADKYKKDIEFLKVAATQTLRDRFNWIHVEYFFRTDFISKVLL